MTKHEANGPGRVPEEFTGESVGPPRVDFDAIAAHAVANGIFATGEGDPQDPTMPVSMLDVPYENGPDWIMDGRPLSQKAIDAVRENFVKANRLLVPDEQVTMYLYHERLLDRDIFDPDGGVMDAVAEYRPGLPYRRVTAFAADELSFQTVGVDRKVKDRNLFTEREMLAAVNLGLDEPAVVLAVLGYRGVMQDYLLQLGMAFGRLSMDPDSGVTGEDIGKYIHYAEAWNSPNFTENFPPAIALYLEQAKRGHPVQPIHSLLDQELFGNAMKFLIDNGAFRRFMTIPEGVDPSQPVRHFLCPGLVPIRNQVGDGNVLYRIYELASSKLAEGDPTATSLAARIRTTTRETLEIYERRRASRESTTEGDDTA